jgi:ribosomal protein S26
MPLPATVDASLNFSVLKGSQHGPFEQYLSAQTATSAGSVSAIGNVSSNTKGAWNFVAASSFELTGIRLSLGETGTITDTFYVTIHSDSSGSPGTLLGTSNALGTGSFGGVGIADQFTFSTPISLTSGSTYWYVVQRTGSLDTSNYLSVSHAASGSIANIGRKVWNGSAWSSLLESAEGAYTLLQTGIFILAVDTTNRHIEMWRSVDGGNTWSESDSVDHKLVNNTSGFAPLHFWSQRQSADIVRVWWFNYSGNGFVNTATFTLSTESWGTSASTSGVMHNSDGVHVTGPDSLFLAAYRSNATHVHLIQGATESIMGTAYRRVSYAVGSAAFATVSGTGAQTHFDIRSIAVDAADRTYFFYGELGGTPASNGIRCKVLTSAGVLGSAVMALAQGNTYSAGNYPHTNAVIIDDTTDKVAIGIIDTNGDLQLSYANVADAPSFSATSITSTNDPEYTNSNAGALALNGLTIYAFWPNDADQDIYRDEGTISGGFTTDVEYKDAVTVNGISIGKITDAIGVLYLDGSTVKYDKHSLVAGPTTSTRIVPQTAHVKVNDLARTVPQTAYIKVNDQTRTVPQTANISVVTSSTRTVPQTAAILTTLTRSIPQTAAIQRNDITRTVPQTAHIKVNDLTRTVPQTAAISVAGQTRVVPQSAAILTALTRSVPQTAAILHTNTRSIPQTASILQTHTRIVPQTANITITFTRTIPQTARISVSNLTRVVPQTAHIKVNDLTRIIPQTAHIKVNDQTRIVPQTAAILTTLTRSIPQTAAILQTNTRIVPQTARINVSNLTRTVPQTARISVSNLTRIVPQTAAIKVNDLTKIVPQTAHIKVNDRTRVVPQSAAILLTLTRTIPQTAAIRTTLTRTIPQSAVISTGAGTQVREVPQSAVISVSNITRTVPQSAHILQTNTRTIPQTAAIRTTLTRTVPQTAAILQTNTRTVPQSAAILLTLTRTIPQTAFISQQFTRTIPQTARISVSGLTRIVPQSVVISILGTATREIPQTAAIKTVDWTRTIPQSAAILLTLSRTIPQTARISVSNLTRVVPQTAAISVSNLQRIVPQSAAILHEQIRSISQSAAISVVDRQAVVPQTAHITTTDNQRVVPQTATILVGDPWVMQFVAQTRTLNVIAVARETDAVAELRVMSVIANDRIVETLAEPRLTDFVAQESA